ncbi:MAG: hypothetical protein R3F42_05095 [Pseudomonadota bacterium]
MRQSRLFATTVLFTLLLAACQPPPAGSGGNGTGADGRKDTAGLQVSTHQTKTEIIDVPETGINLGWGYNLYDSTPLPNKCIEFTPAEEPAQTRTMSMREVNDTYEVMRSMGMTAEASVSVMGYEGSGKASFAKSLNLSGTSTSFVLDASVDNGVRYAGPYDPPEEAKNARNRPQPAIRLTAAAERLAARPEEFLRECGNGFVSAIYSGARLTAVITIHTRNQSEKQDVRAEVSAKGFGATVSGSMHEGTSTTASSADKSMSVFLVGGRGDAIPKDQAQLEARLETLSYAAYEAPKDFRMAVTPYEILPNWPQTQQLRGEVTEFEQLAGLWGDYNTVYDEIEYILDNPALYAAVTLQADGGYALELLRPNTDAGKDRIEYLERLQDYVHQSLRELEDVARVCVSTEETQIDEGGDCSFDETRYLSSYAFWSQLPVDARDTTLKTPEKCPDALTSEPARSDCLKAYAEAVTKRLSTLPRPLDRLAAEQWIIPKSQGRCRFDLLDLGCLTNAEVRHWQSQVGKRLRLVRTDQERAAVTLAGAGIDAKTGAAWLTAAQEQAVTATLAATPGQ